MQEPPKAPDLTVNKVLAGAGAAATSAVLGSFFGAAGTVAGAALGSVASTIATTIYQKSLDRTRDTIVARIRVTGNRGAGVGGPTDPEATTRLPPVPSGSATRPTVEPDVPRSRPRWAMLAGLTVLVFAIAMGAVWAVETAKGSTLTRNETGTSVGRVLEQRPAAPVTEETDTSTPTPTAEPTETGTSEPTTSSSATPTATPSEDEQGATGEPDGSAERQGATEGDGSADQEGTDQGTGGEQGAPTQGASPGSNG